jgi:capsid protein
LGQVIAEQGGDLDDTLVMRQAELAMLDEYNIITDTDPSEVTEGGASQAKPAGVVDPFGDTPAPVVDEEVTEDAED